MVRANITNDLVTHIGNFSVNIAFAEAVTDFALSDLVFTAVSGNGLNDLSWTLTGVQSTYMVNISVPADVQGSFSIGITGQVSVSGTGQDVVAVVKTFRYDTIFEVETAFSRLRYNAAVSEIILPMRFSEDVLWFDRSDLSVEWKAGSEAYFLNYHVLGEGSDYEVMFRPMDETWGAVCVDLTGEVVKESDLVREIVHVEPILISYNNLTPTLADVGTPFRSDDGWWNISLSFESPIVGFGIHSLSVGIDIAADFIYRGLNLDVEPEGVPPPFSDVYPFSEVQGKHCVGEWEYVDLRSEEQARYFWVKLRSDTESEKVPEILLKDVHGLLPVSVAI